MALAEDFLRNSKLHYEPDKVPIHLYLPRNPEYLCLFLHHLVSLHLQKQKQL